jgi:hypothetical protein
MKRIRAVLASVLTFILMTSLGLAPAAVAADKAPAASGKAPAAAAGKAAAPAAKAPAKAPAKAATAVEAPHPWASFKLGAWVQVKSTILSRASGTEQTTITTTKTTLIEKTADKVTMQAEVTAADGQITKSTFMLPVKGYTEPGPEGKVIKRGTETITIAGKPVACDTVEATIGVGGHDILFETWNSKQVPGWLVRSVTTGKGGRSTMEVVDFKAD